MASKGTFKHPTADDWLEPDPTGAAFGEWNFRTGEKRAASAEGWAEKFLSVNLASSVPDEIHDMWVIARGILLYGWFFYPLYAVGDSELHRVADAAVLHRYQQAEGPRTGSGKWPSLNRRLEWLIKEGAIPHETRHRWHAIREVRNEATHASTPLIIMPTDALRSLEILKTEIDALF